MVSTLSSSSTSADAGGRSRAFNALLEIIVSGCSDHQKLPLRLSMVGVTDHVDWLMRTIFLSSATAYEVLKLGVPSRALIALADYLGVGKGPVADLVGLNRAVASRVAASGRPLPVHAAESLLRLMELQCLGEDIFETTDAASAWLRRGHPLLEGEAPLDRVKSGYGTERVKEILNALKHGGVV